MKTLAFVLTLRCPLSCSHCVVDSNPHRRETLDTSLVLNLISQAAKSGVEVIGFTGGEPFIRPKELALFHSEAKSLGLQTIIITSAFFAATEEKTMAALRPFSSVDMLGISTDIYHQQHIPLDRTRLAIRAAKVLQIARIELQVAYASTDDFNATLDALGEDVQDVTVKKQPIWPVGQATSLLSETSDALTPLDRLDLTCPMIGPVVTPDLRLQGCCSSLLNLGDDNPLILGSVSQESLTTIARRMQSNSRYQLLKRFGLRPLLTILKQTANAFRLRPAYTDVCHLCHHLHSEPALRQIIDEYMQPVVDGNGNN